MSERFDVGSLNLTKYLFFTGKGGVGKTSTACATAITLADKGKRIMLVSTDPASNLQDVFNTKLDNKGIEIKGVPNLVVANFEPEEAAREYKESVIGPFRGKLPEIVIKNMEEQLSGSCTVEIAVFRAFANIVEKSCDEVVVIDTAPTGHTLLLLDSTQSYSKEIERSQGDIPESVKKLLPRLRDSRTTEVVIVTLAETTPVYEALRLQQDLNRANINNKWWIINSSMYAANTSNEVLKAKAINEIRWINKVNEISNGNFAIIEWKSDEIKNSKLGEIIE